jgi:hypothetical protein
MQMLACALLLLARTAAAWNGLAVTPPMVSTLMMCTRPLLPLAATGSSRLTPARWLHNLQGWRSWNCFKLEVSQTIIEGQVTAVANPLGAEPSLLALG